MCVCVCVCVCVQQDLRELQCLTQMQVWDLVSSCCHRGYDFSFSHLQRRGVFACCGKVVETTKTPACILVYKEYDKSEKKERTLKCTIELFTAKVETMAPFEPCGSPPNSLPSAHIFLVTMAKDVNEFCVDSRNSLNRWITFPYSAIPREPTANPISETFQAKLDAKSFGAGK